MQLLEMDINGNSPMETPTKRPRSISEVTPSPSRSSPSPASSSASASKKAKPGKGQKKSSSLPTQTVEYLKAWMMSPEHIAHPYPTEQEKAKIMSDTGITLKQLTNWFVNNRKRYWKPRVEARLQQQAQAAVAAQAHAVAAAVASPTPLAPQVQVQIQVPAPIPIPVSNPVSPDATYKPTVSASAVANAYVSFDLCAPVASEAQPAQTFLSQFVPFSFPQINALPIVHAISEASSSASVSTSESDSMSSTTYDELDSDQPDHEVETATRTSQRHSSPIMEALIPDKVETTVVLQTSTPKRAFIDDSFQTPRSKYRRVSVELWRDACQTARNVHDDVLPSLEEAVRLFGYAS